MIEKRLAALCKEDPIAYARMMERIGAIVPDESERLVFKRMKTGREHTIFTPRAFDNRLVWPLQSAALKWFLELSPTYVIVLTRLHPKTPYQTGDTSLPWWAILFREREVPNAGGYFEGGRYVGYTGSSGQRKEWRDEVIEQDYSSFKALRRLSKRCFGKDYFDNFYLEDCPKKLRAERK